MANLLTNTSELTSIANAIRSKTGKSGTISFPNGFVSEIGSIGGGGGGIVTEISVEIYHSGESIDHTFDVIFWEVVEGESFPNQLTLESQSFPDFSCKADSILFIASSDPTDFKEFSASASLGDCSVLYDNGYYATIYIGTDDSITVEIELTD